MAPNALVPVPTFEVLLGRLEDKDVVKLPERIHLAALASLELSKEVTGDLEQEGTRKEIIERYYRYARRRAQDRTAYAATCRTAASSAASSAANARIWQRI